MQNEEFTIDVVEVWKSFSKWFLYSVLSVYLFYISLSFFFFPKIYHGSLAIPLTLFILGALITIFVGYILSKATFDYQKILTIILYSFLIIITSICLLNCTINYGVFLLYVPTIIFMRVVSSFRNTVILTGVIIVLCYVMQDISVYLGIGLDRNSFVGNEESINNLNFIIAFIASYFSLLCLYFYSRIIKTYSIRYTTIEQATQTITDKNFQGFFTTTEDEDVSLINYDKYQELYSKIIRLFEEEKIYRDSDLTIKKLADVLESNTTYVSKSLKNIGNVKFNQLINQYRMNDVLDELNNKNFKIFTLEHIYTKAGFSQQPTFNRIFKDHTGITPREYIDKLE